MSKLQPCPKCGAQFDVSSFAPGSKFTCGACGAVVTAGAPAPVAAAPARVPSASTSASPSRPIPAPAKSSVAGRPRGPQYVPASERRAADAPRPRRARAGDDDAGDEGRGEGVRPRERGAPAKKGMSPAALAGISLGLLALAGGGAFLALSHGDTKPAGGGGSTVATTGGTGPAASSSASTGAGGNAATATPGAAPTPAGSSSSSAPSASPAGGGSVAAIDAEWKEVKYPTAAQYREFLRRYKAVGPAGADRAKEVATGLITNADPNDVDAHQTLGHFEFTADVPEEISFRKYPFCRAVEEARQQRWFSDKEQYDHAMEAFERCKRHAERLENDRVYRSLDTARREIDRDQYFKQYNYDAIFASPYLICYATDERVDPDDLWKLTKSERSKKLAELDAKKKTYQKILAEKARIYQQLYAEFLKRYQDECDLHDLMAEWGGRPDYPASKRSFRDGCPLIVWIFSDRKAFDEYHNKVKQEGISPGVAGYFSPQTGWVYLYDEDNGDREFEINKNVHEGTHQLEHWFTRQKNEWSMPFDPKTKSSRVPQSFFGEGFAEYTGSVTMAPDRTLTFVGYNRPRLKSLQELVKMAGGRTKDGKVPVFPVKDLVGFEGYSSAIQWAGEHWGPWGGGAGLGVFYIQSWAFVYFLNEFENHKYQKHFKRYLDDIMNYPANADHYGYEKFKSAFGLASEADWKRMDTEFRDFYLKKLATMDLATIGKPPPSRDDWPGYVPPDPLAPEKPTEAKAPGATGK